MAIYGKLRRTRINDYQDFRKSRPVTYIETRDIDAGKRIIRPDVTQQHWATDDEATAWATDQGITIVKGWNEAYGLAQVYRDDNARIFRHKMNEQERMHAAANKGAVAMLAEKQRIAWEIEKNSGRSYPNWVTNADVFNYTEDELQLPQRPAKSQKAMPPKDQVSHDPKNQVSHLNTSASEQHA